jgi:pimeloyl-ACP methyl ester carboxylesterase
MSFAIRKPGFAQHYLDEGSGTPIVFVHGWPLNLAMWSPQASALHDRWRVIRMDRRGFGGTGGLASLDDDVGDLVALFAYLDLKDVALVGMSQGARVAMRATAHLNGRLRCLVLDGAPIDELSAASPEVDVPLDRYRELVATGGIAAFRREWIAHPLMRLHAPNAVASALLRNMLDSYEGKDLTAPEASGKSVGFPPVPVADITVPTLVLNGEFDTGRRQLGDVLYGALPFAGRSIISGAGHLPNLDQPREYNEVLTRFIDRQVRVTP